MSIHPSVTRTWVEMEVNGRDHQAVLVVETKLPINPDDPGFDSSAFDDLINAVYDKMKDTSVPNRVRIVPTQ